MAARGRGRRRSVALTAVGLAAVLAPIAVVAASGGPKAGSRDHSFSEDGRVTTRIGDEAAARDVAIDEKGRIVVAGHADPDAAKFAVARYSKAGKLDKSFGQGGKATTAINDLVPGFDFTSANANALAIDGKGRVVVCGYAELGDEDFALARFKSNGKLDAAFGDGGVQTIGFGGDDRCEDVAIDEKGRIIAVGGNVDTLDLVRYKRDGQLDDSFNGTGYFFQDFGFTGTNEGEAVALDGKKIVVAGELDDSPALIRFREDGQLDPGFADAGIKLYPHPGDFARFDSLAIDGKGRYVMGGDSRSAGSADRSIVARAKSGNGALDKSFSGDGQQIYGIAGDLTAVTGVGIDHGKVVASALDSNVQPIAISLRRFDEDGKPDGSFKDPEDLFIPRKDSLGYGLAVTKAGYVVAGYVHLGNGSNDPVAIGVARYRAKPKHHH